MKRKQDVERILEEFTGVRDIPKIKTAKKRVLITKIKNKEGQYHHFSKRNRRYLWRILQETL